MPPSLAALITTERDGYLAIATPAGRVDLQYIARVGLKFDLTGQRFGGPASARERIAARCAGISSGESVRARVATSL